MRSWCRCLLLLQLGSNVLLLEQGTDRTLLCECTNFQCQTTKRTTCLSQYKCYTQYLNKTDGSHSVTKGCVDSSTPILCENRRPNPKVQKVLKWPYLICCDNRNFCNSEVASTPPSWTSVSTKKSQQLDLTSEKNTTVTTSMNDPSSNFLAFWVKIAERKGNNDWPISKLTILSVLFVGLFLLIIIMAFGFYILKSQSNYLTQLRRGYERATDEENVSPSSRIPDTPLSSMTLLTANSEENNNLNNLKSI